MSCLPVCLPACLPACLSACLPTRLRYPSVIKEEKGQKTRELFFLLFLSFFDPLPNSNSTKKIERQPLPDQQRISCTRTYVRVRACVRVCVCIRVVLASKQQLTRQAVKTTKQTSSSSSNFSFLAWFLL